ncbi:hypothetical protein Tco_0113967, partial [Tanacetum coccineum]
SFINDPKPPPNTSDMDDAQKLSAFVVKLRDIPEGGSGVYKEPHNHDKPVQEILPFYCTPHATVGTVISDPTPDELAVTKPNAKVLAKVEAPRNSE